MNCSIVVPVLEAWAKRDSSVKRANTIDLWLGFKSAKLSTPNPSFKACIFSVLLILIVRSLCVTFVCVNESFTGIPVLRFIPVHEEREELALELEVELELEDDDALSLDEECRAFKLEEREELTLEPNLELEDGASLNEE